MTFVLRGRPEAENNNTVINTPWFNTELKMLETPFKPERWWSQSRVRSSNIRHLKISHKPSGVELKLSVPAGAVVTSSLVKTALFLTSNVWNVWAARQTLQLILIWRPPESRGQKYISLTFWVERDQSGCFVEWSFTATSETQTGTKVEFDKWVLLKQFHVFLTT